MKQQRKNRVSIAHNNMAKPWQPDRHATVLVQITSNRYTSVNVNSEYSLILQTFKNKKRIPNSSLVSSVHCIR